MSNWASNMWMGVGGKTYSCITPDGHYGNTGLRTTGLTPYGMSDPARLMNTPKRIREALFKTPTPPRPMSRTPLALSSPGSPELGPLIPDLYVDIFSGDEESPVIHAGALKRKISDIEGGSVLGPCKRRSLKDHDKENWGLGRQLFSGHHLDELEPEDAELTSQDPSIISSSSPQTGSFGPIEEACSSPLPSNLNAASEAGHRSVVMLLPSDVRATFPAWFRQFPPLNTTNESSPGSGAVRNIATGFVRKGSGTGSCRSGHSVSLHKNKRPTVLSADDLYTARWVKGKGNAKLGLCPVCYELDGVVAWFPMKVSAYNYHMQHVHGISAATLRPMPPPDHVCLCHPDDLPSMLGPFGSSKSHSGSSTTLSVPLSSCMLPNSQDPRTPTRRSKTLCLSSPLTPCSSASTSPLRSPCPIRTSLTRPSTLLSARSSSARSSLPGTDIFAARSSTARPTQELSSGQSRKPLKRKLPLNDQSKIHGFCGTCQLWVCVEGETELKVPEIVWWKHARACQLSALAVKSKPCDKRRVA